MGKKGTRHRKYSKDEKMKYVRLHLDEHMSLRQIEKEYGIGNALVGTWVKKYLEEGENALEPHNGNPYAALHRSKSLTEVERLRLLVAKQEVEIARLKKSIMFSPFLTYPVHPFSELDKHLLASLFSLALAGITQTTYLTPKMAIGPCLVNDRCRMMCGINFIFM